MTQDNEFQQTIRYAHVKLKNGTPVEVQYVLDVDWVRMRELAERAARNKGRIAKAGPITVLIPKLRKRCPQPPQADRCKKATLPPNLAKT